MKGFIAENKKIPTANIRNTSNISNISTMYSKAKVYTMQIYSNGIIKLIRTFTKPEAGITLPR